MEGSEEKIFLCGQVHQFGYFGGSDGYRFVYHYVFAGFEHLAGQIEVGAAGSAHHD